MKADMIITSNKIFDSVQEKPFKGFVAIKDGRILEVSSDSEYNHLVDEHTQTFHYEENTVMAGFHDSHIHLLMAGLFGTHVNLIHAKSEEEAVKMVKDFVEASDKNPEWIIGFQWYQVFWDNKTIPTKKSLDAYFPDKPVCLIDAEAHGAWVNSKALEIAGITKDTPNPPNGEIFRFEDGEATGFLSESAIGLVSQYAFVFSPEQEKEIIKTYMRSAAKQGITSINDVQPYFHGNMGNLEVYSALDKADELTVRVHVAPNLLGDLDLCVEWRDKYKSDKLRVDMTKQFLDGVCATRTALVLEDYIDDPGNQGTLLGDPEAMRIAVQEAHKRGLSVKLHAVGDRSTRMALDFYQEAIEKYGKNECRHAIEHIELLAEEDLPRFGEMGIIPSVQPEHMALAYSFSDNPYPVVLGKERADKTWPLKSLYDTVGVLAMGSDCPVADQNPFLEIFRGTERVYNDGNPKGGWNPTEKISMYEMLRSYTYGSAYGVRREDELGTLTQGKFADVVVIDRDLFSTPKETLQASQVILTVMNGKVVYQK